MQLNKPAVWALGGLLILGLVVQSVLLWQTRQELAELRGDDADLPDSIEERLLARLDAQQPSRPLAKGGTNLPGNSSTLTSPFGLLGGFPADPFARMEQMRQQMNSVFGSSFAGIGGISGFSGTQFSLQSPEIALEETAEDFRVRITVPEQHEIDLQTEVEDQQITVVGKVTAELSNQNANQNGNASSQMLSSSQFSRRFNLPGAIDELGVHTLQDEQGLVVVIPKKSDSV